METISYCRNTYSTSASFLDSQLDIPSLPNSIDAKIVEQVLSRKCKIHPSESSNLIYLNKNAENIRICYVCAREQGIPHKKLVLIRQLLNITPEGFLPSFPVLNDEQLSSNVKKMIDSMDLVIEQVDEFFNQLKESINASIEKSRQAQRLKLDSLANQYMKVLELFQEVSQIGVLQEILIDSVDSQSQDVSKVIDSETNKLRQFIAEHLEKSEENTKTIKDNYEEFLQIKNTFSLDQPLEIQAYVNELIQQQLDMFGNSKEFVPYLPKIELNAETGSPFSTKNSINDNTNNSNNQIKSMTSFTNKSPKICIRTPKMDNNKIISSNSGTSSAFQLPQFSIAIKKSLLQTIAFIPSKDFKQSQINSEICKQLNGTIKIRNKDTTNNTIQCFMSQNLASQEKYIIRLKLQNYNSYPNICVGLLEEENKEKQWLCESEMYYNEVNGGDVRQIIKGGQLYCGEKKKIGEKELEFRVHLADRVFKIGNYPSYENVVQLEKGFKIRPYKEYLFAISINNFNDSVIVSEFQTVSKFDEQM